MLRKRRVPAERCRVCSYQPGEAQLILTNYQVSFVCANNAATRPKDLLSSYTSSKLSSVNTTRKVQRNSHFDQDILSASDTSVCTWILAGRCHQSANCSGTDFSVFTPHFQIYRSFIITHPRPFHVDSTLITSTWITLYDITMFRFRRFDWEWSTRDTTSCSQTWYVTIRLLHSTHTSGWWVTRAPNGELTCKTIATTAKCCQTSLKTSIDTSIIRIAHFVGRHLAGI